MGSEHLVIGPPGTGKTTYLKEQIVRAAEKYDVKEIFVGSLTRGAASEIASRLDGVPRRNVGTLHSHAFALLDRPRIAESSGALREWNEQCPVGSWAVDLKHAATPEGDSPMVDASGPADGAGGGGYALYEAMGIYRQRMVVDRGLWRAEVRAFADAWDQWKGESDIYDFTDLIEQALVRCPELPGCKVLMLDEAQDMSRLEFALARKWGKEAEVFVVVGDPDQNLYEWRGSEPAAFYEGDIASRRVLSQSWRVPPAVHAVAVDWISQIEGRVDAEYKPFIRDGVVGAERDGIVEHGGGTYRDPDPLVGGLLDVLATGAGTTVMVLGACNYMLNPVVRRLRELGIGFHNPYRTKNGAWNPLIGARRLLAFLRPSVEVWGSESRMWTWQDLRAWTEVLQAAPCFRRGFKAEVVRRCDKNRFGDLGDDTVGIATVLDWCANDEAREAVLSMDLDWFERSLIATQFKSQQYALTVARSVYGASALRERPRIIVGTVHSVKGGEADWVFLFPDLSQAGYENGWVRAGGGRNATVRMMYVGMTRAKHALVLCEASDPYAVTWR